MRQPRLGLVLPIALLLGAAACEPRDTTVDPDREATMPGEPVGEAPHQDPGAFAQDMNRNLDDLDQSLADHRQQAEQNGTVPPATEQRIQQLENEIQQLRQRLANIGQQEGPAFQQEARDIEREYQRLEQRVQQLDQEPASQLQR